MTPDQIQVGKYYRNSRDESSLYLGAGKRVMWEGNFTNSESNFTNKQLVIVGPLDNDMLGQVVQNPEDCFKGFWDNFYMVS